MSSLSDIELSVVIPVHNGGADLERQLRSLLNQKGCRLDIIVLDSGSDDGSSSLAALSANIRWISLPQASFSHSATRNHGVSLTRFPLVLLTVQDASFDDPTALQRLAELLKWHDLAALSVAERPRPDADAYAKYALHRFYQGLFDDADTVVHDAWTGTRLDKIVAASIGNVACLYRRDVFERFPFEGRFAEDFSLAARLLQDGRRVGKTHEVLVTHSHTRPAFYAFQRAFLSCRLMRDHGVDEPGTVNESYVLELLGQTARLFTSEDDSRFAAWIEAMDLPPVKAPLDADLQAVLDDAKPFEPEGDAAAVFRLKVLADKLGWLVGRVDGTGWSSQRRPLVEHLGDGV
jgi:glycosyltransferase involved in cell wall biosynthesis